MKKKTAFIILLIIGLVGSLIVVERIIAENTSKAQEEYKDWLSNNCDCVEKKKPRCPVGFELSDNEKMCKKEAIRCPTETGWYLEGVCEEITYYTNRLLSCSQYNCSGKIVNFTNGKWQ